MQVDVRTIDTSLGPLSALHELHSGPCDSVNEPLLLDLINEAAETYTEEGSFDSLNGSAVGELISSFAFNSEGEIIFAGGDANLVGTNIDDFVNSADRSGEQIYALLAPQNASDSFQPPSQIWSQSEVFNPLVNASFTVRSLMTYHAPSESILGATYAAMAPCDADTVTNFVGPTTSASLTAIKDYINDGDYVTISHSSSATELALEDNIFRVAPNNRAQIPAIVDLIESDNNTHIVIVQRDDVWGNDLVDLSLIHISEPTRPY